MYFLIVYIYVFVMYFIKNDEKYFPYIWTISRISWFVICFSELRST